MIKLNKTPEAPSSLPYIAENDVTAARNTINSLILVKGKKTYSNLVETNKILEDKCLEAETQNKLDEISPLKDKQKYFL